MATLLKKIQSPTKLNKILCVIFAFLIAVSAFMNCSYAWFTSQSALNSFFNTSNVTYDVELIKYEKVKNNKGNYVETKNPLKDAEFILYQKTDKGDIVIESSNYTDENGKISVSGLGKGEYYFREITTPAGYTFDTDGDGKDIKIYPFTLSGMGETVKVTAYNKKVYAPLTITKTVVNADGSPLTDEQKNQEFTFTVVFSDDGTYKYNKTGDSKTYSVKSGETLTLKHNQTATFIDVPLGIHFKVTEEKVPNYTITSEDNSGNICYPGAQVKFTNTFTAPETGNLNISKTVSGVGSDKNKEFEFVVTFSDVEYGNGADGEFTYKIGNEEHKIKSGGTIKLKDGQTAVFTNIPVGTTYTVTEKDYSSDGYTASIKDAAGTISSSNANVRFNNNKPGEDAEFGSLTFSKTVLDSTDKKEFEFTVVFGDLTKDEYKNKVYTYYLNGDTEHPKNFVNGQTVKLKHGDSVQFANIPVGTKYSVTEHNYKSEGYTSTIGTVTGTIAEGDVANIPFFNEKHDDEEKTYGSLQVSKRITGNAADPTKAFTFTVKFGKADYGNGSTGDFVYYVDGDAHSIKSGGIITLKGGQSAVFTGLPAGITYEVVENNANTDGYISTVHNESGKIVASTVAYVDFVNDKETTTPGDKGTLTISKTVSPTTDTRKFEFIVTFDNSTGKTYKYYINGNPKTTYDYTSGEKLHLGQGDTIVFIDLPVGTIYHVTEAKTEGYEATTNNASGAIAKGNVASVSFHNVGKTTEKKYGALEVSKKITGNAADPDKLFTFTVNFGNVTYGNGSDGTFTYYVGGKAHTVKAGEPFTLKGGQTAVFNLLQAGITYNVVENNANTDGYISTKDHSTGDIVDSTVSYAEFVNSKNDLKPGDKGSLTISKTVNPTSDTKKFNFRVTFTNTDAKSFSYILNGDTDTTHNFTNGSTISLGHGDVIKFVDLPVGTKYQITEIKAEGYQATTKEVTGSIAKGDVAKVSFHNVGDVVEKKYGSLQINKQVTGEGASQDKEFTFKVTFGDAKYGNGSDGNFVYYVDGERHSVKSGESITLKGGQTATFSELPANLSYVVEENNPTADGYTASNTYRDGTIVESTVSFVKFVNYKGGGGGGDEKGSLTVSKTVTPSSDKTIFNFTVVFGTNKNDGKKYTYYKNGNKNDTYPFTNGDIIQLSHNETATFIDLPVGTVYTVTEAQVDGYTASSGGGGGIIVEGDVANVSVHNVKDDVEHHYTNLTVLKTVENQDGSQPTEEQMNKSFKFHITFSDGQKYSYKLNGVGYPLGLGADNSFTLKHGQYALFENIPEGVTYSVVEDDYSADSYYTTSVFGGNATLTMTNQRASFTNTYVGKETIEVSGEKTWDLSNAPKDTQLPTEVVITLKGSNGTTYTKTVKPNAAGKWLYTFDDLPKYDAKDNLVTYTIGEVNVDGYVTSTNGYNVKNTYITPATFVTPTVQKTFIVTGENPTVDQTFSFTLTSLGGAPMPADSIGGVSKTVSVSYKAPFSASSDKAESFGNISYTTPGTYSYTIAETRGSASGVAYDTAVYTMTVVVKEQGGKLVTAMSITKDGAYYEDSNFKFTNTYDISNPKTSVKVSKVWAGEANPSQPQSVTATLYRDGAVYKTAELSATNSWTYNWTGLDITGSDGKAYTYSVDEVTVPKDYSKIVTGNATEGYTITNTYSPNTPGGEVTSISVEKKWVNNGNTQPTGVTATLYKNGVINATVVLNSSNTWKNTWHNLDASAKWTVDEVIVPSGYTKQVTGSADKGFTITNTYTGTQSSGKSLTVSGTKTWVNGANKNQPTQIVVYLRANGDIIRQRQVTASDKWSYSFTVDKYDENGKEITYTIDEASVDGYTMTVNGYNITNTYTPTQSSGPGGGSSTYNTSSTGNTTGGNPYTGDNSTVWIWFVMLIVSAVGLKLLLFWRKKPVDKVQQND